MAKATIKNQKIGKIDSVEGLKAKFAEIENQKSAFNSKKLLNANELKQVKADLMKEIFNMMMEAGVDLNNLESINKFLAELEQKNPDLLELFQSAFNGMLGDEEMASMATPPMAPGLAGEAPPMPGSGGQVPPMPGATTTTTTESNPVPKIMNPIDNARNSTFR